MNSLNSDYKLYFKILRPWQWAKNTLIIIPIVLSNSFDLDKFLDSIGLFFLFSFYVSGNYILNDLNDIDLDRNHPEKKYRPIASGEVSEKIAKRIAYFLFASSLLITYINYEIEIVYLYLIYLLIAVVYTKNLKFINFIDSIAISTLFLIRLTIGGIVVNLDITIFLYIFTFFISMFIVYLKKNSILHKKFIDDNLFHKKLIDQNNKLNFNYILIMLGIATNLSLILWSINLTKDFSNYKIIALIAYNAIFVYIIFRLINNSKKAELEDFVFGLFKDKVLIGLLVAILILFIYFYF
ncbi:UbiA family prenyltransferase [Acidimicrobiaceae bacterium]|nr:UbiA family prenyltransferase [Acidimicrobiaceae bacterium]|tara:strand:+ start:1433 stop:2320 length:888 start_codon:yes stop_codon:yes gene_type:complete